jgi:hypothetical protein
MQLMKTLKDHYLVYDDACPMCNLYTNAFINTGMLDNKGRVKYEETAGESCIDRDRARNEIALVNRQSGEVIYGLKSLMTILSFRFGFLKPLFRSKLFFGFWNLVYKFISFNRKIIVPSSKDGCVPDFNLRYRIGWLIFCWIITALILSAFGERLPIPDSSASRELLICGGQIFFQGGVLRIITRKWNWDYLGNMMTISLAGALGLLLFMAFGIDSLVVNSLLFLFTAFFMMLEHIRRVSVLKLPAYLTATWVAYRFIILTFIL